MMRSAIQLISSNWPYWNRTQGADHFFVMPHDFDARFHSQVSKPFSFCLALLFPLDSVDKFSQCILIFESIDLNMWFPEELLRLLSFWYI